jgi:hypothetical protein
MGRGILVASKPPRQQVTPAAFRRPFNLEKQLQLCRKMAFFQFPPLAKTRWSRGKSIEFRPMHKVTILRG